MFVWTKANVKLDNEKTGHPTKANVKLANRKVRHSWGIGVILCPFTNSPIMYLMGLFYYCPGHPSNTISLGALKYYVGFQKVTTDTLEYCDYFDPHDCIWIWIYRP